jgi:uncharacterized membrane protein (DUF2068 family)
MKIHNSPAEHRSQGAGGARESSSPAVGSEPVPERDRLLGWIAAERGVRAVVLLAVGLVLVTHPHANWASDISNLARRLGLDPSGTGIRKIIEKIRHISAHQDMVFGVVALAYGVLEGVEAYGLYMRKRWAEWLTVLATALLLIPEALELAKSASPLKVGGIVVNLLVVGYLLWRLRRSAERAREAR